MNPLSLTAEVLNNPQAAKLLDTANTYVQLQMVMQVVGFVFALGFMVWMLANWRKH